MAEFTFFCDRCGELFTADQIASECLVCMCIRLIADKKFI